MGLPLIGGLLRAGAKAGIIRGTVGKALGYKAPAKAAAAGFAGGLASQLPAMINQAPSVIGKVLRNSPQVSVGANIAGDLWKRYGPGGGTSGTGKRRRRINPTNPRALRRALSRVEQFEKLVKRSFIVKDIKPRKSRSCR